MSRWLTAGLAAALIFVLAVAALWSSAPPAAQAQTAPDVRLREPPPQPTSAPAAESSRSPATLTLRIANATLDEDRRALADGADLTLLAQPTYVALPSAGPNLLRISPAVTITARDAEGRATSLSPAARLTFSQPGAAAAASVYRLEGKDWRVVPTAGAGEALTVQPAAPGTYAVFAELPPGWALQHDGLAAAALNAARLVVDDLAARS